MGRRLKIDFVEIQKAMEDIVRDAFDYFLDLKTGEAITLSGDILREVRTRLYDGDGDDIGDDIECIEFDEEPEVPHWMEDEVELALEVLLDEDGRYIRIPERDSKKAYRVMADFMETIEEPVLKEKLTRALNGKGAFKRFKDVLLEYPKERKRWHGYDAKAMKRAIIEWLRSLRVEPANLSEKGGRYVRETEL